MGRKSALTDKQWARIERKFELRTLYEEARSIKNNERAVVVMLKLMLAFGDLSRALSVPKISGHRFEFPLGAGRADLVLFHTDGSVSVVEAKAQASQVTIAQGIGQLCMYATMLPGALDAKMAPITIRRILCAPMHPEKCTDLVRASAMAGVIFINLPEISAFKKRIDAIC